MSDAARWVIAADTREGFVARAREVWQYRRILGFFSLKAVQSLYAKTRLGVSWIFIRTLVPLFVGSFVFGSVMNVPSGGVPYFVFFLAGQIPWNCFDGPLIRGSRGLEVNRMLLTKLYVPRIILPLGQMTAGIVEPAIITLVFVGALVYYRIDRRHLVRAGKPAPVRVARVVALILVVRVLVDALDFGVAGTRAGRAFRAAVCRQLLAVFHARDLSDVGGAADHSLADVSQSAHGADRDVQMGNAARRWSIPGPGSAIRWPSRS